MRYSVTPLRRKGVRLTKEDVASAQPFVGEMTVKDWPEGNSFKRFVRVAQLTNGSTQFQSALIQPIFDPVIVKMDGDSFVLLGTELHTDQERTSEHIQCWWVKAAL